MTLIFDGADTPMTDNYFGLLALVPVGWAVNRKLIGRPVTRRVPAIALLLGMLVSGIAYWDAARNFTGRARRFHCGLRARATQGKQPRSNRGPTPRRYPRGVRARWCTRRG